MKCLFCQRDQDEYTLIQWQNKLAYWGKLKGLNVNLYCPRCLPTDKERCIGCGLHWPVDLIHRRSCKSCRAKTRRRDRKDKPLMTERRFNKFYRET